MNETDDGSLNLNVVNEAFGHRSDLYMDVLQVQPNAGSDQIQEAYFDRRNELFQLLAEIDHTTDDSVMDSHRQHAERKMDAVVCAVRILGDPDLRLQYDDVRNERVRHHSPVSSARHRLRKSMDAARGPKPETPSRKLHSPSSLNSRRTLWQNVETSPTPDLQNVSGTSMNTSTMYTDFSYSSRSKGTTDGTFLTSPSVDDDGSSSRYMRSKSTPSLKKLAPPPLSSKQPRNSPAELQQERARSVAQRQPLSLSRRMTSSSLDGDVSTQFSKGSTTYFDDDDYEEDETLYTVDDGESLDGRKTRASDPSSEEGFLDRLRAEVLGAIDDTAMALEQVLNAFTLQEADIRAVMGRIDKAKRQVATTHVFYPSFEKEDNTRDSKKSSKSKGKKTDTKSASHQKSVKGRTMPLSATDAPAIGLSSRRQLH